MAGFQGITEIRASRFPGAGDEAFFECAEPQSLELVINGRRLPIDPLDMLVGGSNYVTEGGVRMYVPRSLSTVKPRRVLMCLLGSGVQRASGLGMSRDLQTASLAFLFFAPFSLCLTMPPMTCIPFCPE